MDIKTFACHGAMVAVSSGDPDVRLAEMAFPMTGTAMAMKERFTGRWILGRWMTGRH
jgi:hypothetical protein